MAHPPQQPGSCHQVRKMGTPTAGARGMLKFTVIWMRLTCLISSQRGERCRQWAPKGSRSPIKAKRQESRHKHIVTTFYAKGIMHTAIVPWHPHHCQDACEHSQGLSPGHQEEKEGCGRRWRLLVSHGVYGQEGGFRAIGPLGPLLP